MLPSLSASCFPLMATKRKINLLLLLSFSWSFFVSPSCSETDTDTISQGEEMRDWQRLVSANGIFRLVFFRPGTPEKRYLGIYLYLYYLPTSIWVANRNNPILDTSGSLMIDGDGNLRISSRGSSPIILNSVRASGNTSATLLDNGNFVLRELNPSGEPTGRILWQSFDYPTDTLLPGMKLGINFRTGHTWSLTSWRSDSSPAPGSFTFGLDPNSTSQLAILWRGDFHWRSGSWLNGTFEYVPFVSFYSDNRFKPFSNENETYFSLTYGKEGKFLMFKIIPNGQLMAEWNSLAPFGVCNVAGDPEDESMAGCAKDKLPECRDPNMIYAFEYGTMLAPIGFRFPDSDNLSLVDCQAQCFNNCSCVAFAAANDDGTGCEIWDRGSFLTSNGWSQRYMAHIVPHKGRKWWIWVVGAVGGAMIIFLSCSLCYVGWQKRKLLEENKRQQQLLVELGAVTTPFVKYSDVKGLKNDGKKSNELKLFSFRSITTATNNFSDENRLGQGGFGHVYKGKLLDGQEIAIKRLSKGSKQGLDEFKNEIVLIANLQHNNLVGLLGCCIEGEERILIYEYLSNKSLDFFLFDHDKKHLLDWKKRYNIIEGVAQGLLYLHKYSRLRVIHRDLKVSNILLDNDMNPKISDFGLARMFGGNEFEANTKRIAGTYGYMSPEYVLGGIFSTKSDVFSFGVLLLEIVSSRKNYSQYHHERPLNLIGHAWELWREGRALELLDQTLGDLCPNDVVLRCIQVGLLCVQDNQMDRPTMADAVSMLANEISQLPPPRQPAFFIESSLQGLEIYNNNTKKSSLNNASITETEAR